MAAALVTLTPAVLAQEAGGRPGDRAPAGSGAAPAGGPVAPVAPGGPGGFGGRGGSRGFNAFPEVDALKAQLGSTDEEWKVIGAQIRKVAMLRQTVEADRSGFNVEPMNTPQGEFRRRFGGGAFGGPGAGAENDRGRAGRGGGNDNDRRGGGNNNGGAGVRRDFGPRGGGFGGPGGAGGTNADATVAPPAPADFPASGEARVTPPPTDVTKPVGPPAGASQPPPGAPPLGGGFGGAGGPFGRDPVAAAHAELQMLLATPDAPADQVAQKLAALREAKRKAKADLDAAAKELQLLVTPEQEVILVRDGYLE
ncbi:MAG: hypothetical protein ACAI43_19040 [Phycisphaerae bacterium]